MKSLIVAFILGLSITSLAFAEGERSALEDCGAYSESETRQNTKQSQDSTNTETDTASTVTNQ